MVFGDFLARMGGGRKPDDDASEGAGQASAGPPTGDALLAALERTEELVTSGTVPSTVTARVLRVTAAVRDTLPRLDQLGAGSASAYNVMATATDYLPDAVNGYLRLPRRFADTRPVDGGRTSLMVLVDQLDLLGATMDRVFDAVYRSDANALVAHGRFLQEKFGRGGVSGASPRSGDLVIGEGETALPTQPDDAAAGQPGGLGGPGETEPAPEREHEQASAEHTGTGSVPAAPPEEPAPLEEPGDNADPAPPDDPGTPADSPGPADPAPAGDPAPDEPQRLRPPSSLDL